MNTRAFIKHIPPLAWVITLTVLCAGIFGNLLGNVTTELSDDLHLSAKHIGWLVFIGSTGSALGAFLGGDIAYRVRPLVLIYAYLAGMLASIMLLVSSSQFITLAAGFLCYEIMLTALLTLSHTMIGHMDLSSAIRARMLALLDVGWSVGASIAPIWVVFLLRGYPSWRFPYALFILLVVALIVAYSRTIIRTSIDAIHLHRQPNADAHPTRASHTYWQLIASRWTIWAWVAAILIGYVEWGHTYWFVNYAHQGRAIALDNARWGLLAFTAGMVLARAWQTFVHSHLSTEQRLVRLSIVGCVMFALIAWFPNPTMMPYVLIINFFAGVGIGIVFPILLNHLIDFAPHDTAKFSALLMFGILIGAQLAGLIIGYVTEHLNINWGYATIALAMFGFTFATLKLFAVHKHHPSFNP